MTLSHTYETIRDGRTFVVEVHSDDYRGLPWEEYDGHGNVSDWTTREKRPGEWILREDRGSRRYYDAQEAQARALREGWQASTASAAYGTKAEQAARAVRSDFEWLRAWCNDEWHYVGIVVYERLPACETCGQSRVSDSASLWGIESDDAYYHDGGAGLDELIEEAITLTDAD